MTTAEKIKEGCGKRTDFENNGLFYKKPICSFGNLCEECQARLSQHKSDLQQELEFLKKSFCNKCCSSCMYNVEGRIIEIKKELEEIETCQ